MEFTLHSLGGYEVVIYFALGKHIVYDSHSIHIIIYISMYTTLSTFEKEVSRHYLRHIADYTVAILQPEHRDAVPSLGL